MYQKLCSFISFLLTLGPALPTATTTTSLLEIQGDVYAFGGWDGKTRQSAIHKLSCSSSVCKWTTLNQKLKVGRSQLVAIPVPDSLCT